MICQWLFWWGLCQGASSFRSSSLCLAEADASSHENTGCQLQALRFVRSSGPPPPGLRYFSDLKLNLDFGWAAVIVD